MELFGFGPHLIVDGYHASGEKLADAALIAQVLEELPRELGLTLVLPVQVSECTSSHSKDNGLMGVAVIAESHIAIQTFPERGFISVDVFSCQEFDSQHVIGKLTQVFEIGRFDTHFINRGKEFPKNIAEIQRILQGQREYLEARIA